MPRPDITLSDAQKAEVETLAAVLNAQQIADYFGVGRTTFFAIMERDPDVAERYKRGKARAVGAVAQSLISKARAGNVTCMIFYLKTQAGWRETTHVETTVRQDDAPRQAIDLSKLSTEALRELVAAAPEDNVVDAEAEEVTEPLKIAAE